MDHIHFGSCGCAEESKGPLDMYSLNEEVDFSEVACLNEHKLHAGKSIIRPYEDRLSVETFVESSMDGELIFIVNFKKEIRLRAINVRCEDKENAPKTAKVWANRSDIDFDSVTSFKPQAQISLPFDFDTSIKSPLRGTAFNNVNTLVIHLSAPYNPSEELKVYYLGFYGSFTGASRGIVDAKYEAVPMPGDHKLQNPAESTNTQYSS